MIFRSKLAEWAQFGSIWNLLGLQARALSLPRWRILFTRNSSRLKWPRVIQRQQHVVRRRGFALSGDTFGHRGSIPPAIRDDSAPRRSQRVIVKVSMMVLAQRADNKPLSEETRAVTVNAHGAMILLGLKVSIGQLLTLRNSRTGEEVACRVVYVSAHESEKRQVGVDFIKPCPRFWRIPFPPPDWNNSKSRSQSQPSSTRTNSKHKK